MVSKVTEIISSKKTQVELSLQFGDKFVEKGWGFFSKKTKALDPVFETWKI